jgi:hypothetical protein
MDKLYGIAIGNLWASVHTLRILINRGLVSPEEVDEVYGSLIEGLQSGDPEFAALFESKLEGIFAEMRSYAQKLWKG